MKKALEGNDTADIKAKTEALMNASMKLGEAMYKQQQAEAAATGAGDAGASAASDEASSDDKPKEEDVVDADFEEVKK